MNRHFLTFTLSLMLLMGIVLPGCNRQEAPYRTAEGMEWHTLYHVTYQSDRCLDDTITAVMKRIELSLSPFNEHSVVSAINRGESLEADTLVAKVLLESKRVNALSGGAFDPTVAPLVNLWGFGFEEAASDAPTQCMIDSCLALVGIAECGVDERLTVRKKNPGTKFDFSAITKGLGCDEVGRALERNGVTNYMVEIGGEVALRGVNSRGETWRIQIDAPIDTAVVHDRMAVTQLTDCGVATSGNYRNWHRQADGTRVWHTISPSTGRPAVSDMVSATVVAPTCMTADALATACMALPSSEAAAMITKAGAKALLVVAEADSLRMIPVGGFQFE